MGYFVRRGIKIHWNFWLLPKGFSAITLFGHVFSNRSKDELAEYLNSYRGRKMVNHELIHVMQANGMALSYFSFYVLYLSQWVRNLFVYGIKNNNAYRNIPFEREAYANETDFDYPDRGSSQWKKYTDKYLKGK